MNDRLLTMHDPFDYLSENFAVVLSRVSPAPSNASKYQRQCVVSGAEVIRRVTGVENMSPPVLCQMLRLGKNTDAAKEMSKLIQRVFPEKKKKLQHLNIFHSYRR